MSGGLPRFYRPERAVAADESVSWVVVDEDLELQVEACAYLAGLRGRAGVQHLLAAVSLKPPSRPRNGSGIRA
ncbi:hypothetical protein [Nonomuraea polychroma]|uniref:hypothetical protein n=1 Tax=Nonomuraea polychroma TaxID=46176 RepID=UPI000FDE22A1|nr:hypothetical protein [Nonomuraea polychroma]